MDAHPGPAEGFVRRLLANAALENLPPLQKEEQILQFLHANAQALHPTLSSPQFFPGRRWAEILLELRQSLAAATDAALKPWLESWIGRELDLRFLEAIASRSLPDEAVRRELLELVFKLLAKPDARGALIGPLTAVQLGIPDRYIESAFEQRQYVHFELTKVQRLRLDPGATISFLAATMLLRPVIHLFTAAAGSPERQETAAVVSTQFASTVLASLRPQLRAVPPTLLRSAVSSNCSFLDDRRIEATARLAAVFASRARNYNPQVQGDRGAHGPDSSWFNIARRNYKYYGFDIKMLDELYRIAAENGW
jgi:hypothetical protein